MDELFLEKYVNSYSPSGAEMLAQQLWIDEVKKHSDEVVIENYGNVIAKRNYKGGELFGKSILLESHVDEVSYRVNLITEDGLIYVIKNGNADHQIAPSSRVKIHTEKGMIDGVFGWPAIHTRDASKETQPTIENIFIDCGVGSRKELTKLGVKTGCLVTYPSNFQILGNYYTGKGLDNKIGGYILLEVLKKFKEFKSVNEVMFANVVQEEAGLRGASMICQNYKPNLSIVIDVTHDTSTPMMNKKKSGNVSCGKGPILTFATTTHSKFVNFLEKVAIDNNIKYQRKALGKATGTDADNYAGHGIITALISIPLRYMHTKVEMVHARDVENAIDLLFNILKELDKEQDFSLFK
jgi:putative aminopeptidase FrvX